MVVTVTAVGPIVIRAVPPVTYVQAPAALLYHPVVVSLARVSEGEPTAPAASFTGPVIDETPVVARLCVKAVPISDRLLFMSADLIVVPAT